MNRTGSTVIAVLLAASAIGQEVVNEGSGSRRDALDRMVYEPAPTTVILEQDEWIGDAPTLGDISGRPVVVFTWAEWYRPSQSVAMLAKSLAAEHPDLVVIGVHDAEGWEQAQTFVERRDLGFPVVRDAEGAIRNELMVDQDPDVYVFDRAGQVRYADITTASLRTAVEEVVGEDTEAASTVESRLESRRAEAERERRRARAINEGVGFENQLNVPFVKPSAEEYAAVDWPERELTERERRRNRRNDTGPVRVPIPEAGFYEGRVPNTNGRVVVMYLWHPSSRETIDDLMFRMDDLQRKYSRDVVVIGAMVAPEERRRRNEPEDPIRALPATNDTIDQYVGSRQIDHYLIPSQGSPLPSNTGRRNRATFYGTVGIVSTDGILRRQELSSNWDEIRRALDTTLRVDPGIRARRAAEDAFIRGGG